MSMDGVELIDRYFPGLDKEQRTRFAALGELYRTWNARVNLISRKDIDHLYGHHVLHSLGIAKVHAFRPGNRVVDVGTGGGFPGIPLAILFPGTTFHCIDGTAKKIRAVQGVIDALGLGNATAEQVRSEEHRQQYDLVVSRAVTALPDFIRMVEHLVPRTKRTLKGKEPLRSGVLYLKGGDIQTELRSLKQPVRLTALSDFFAEEFFREKMVVEVAL